MCILMVSPYVLWLIRGGGATRMYHLLRKLARQGHRVVLLAGTADPSLTFDTHFTSLCEGLHVYPLPGSSGQIDRRFSAFSLLQYPAGR
jgi:hypothetical protein